MSCKRFLPNWACHQLGEFGLKLENVDAFLVTLKANKGEAFGGFKKITLEDARAIYESASSFRL